MIYISIFGEDFEQDVRPLIKAFFPEEELAYLKDAEPESGEFIRLELLKDRFNVDVHINNSVYSEKSMEKLDSSNRRQYRGVLHRVMYEILARITGKELPWGTLTGIRPTKQVLERLYEGATDEKIKEYFSTEYLCSDAKIKLAIKTAKKEKTLLASVPKENVYSLYIGIPFCPSTCSYCSFTSYPLAKYSEYVEPYLDALWKEIEFAAGQFKDKKLISIYIGGGTPTTLDAGQLKRLIRKVKDEFDLGNLAEWTIEAGRPDSITYDKLKVMKEEGIERISINPQSMQQKTLDLIGRRHTVEQIVDTFRQARELGFENINMDLIAGLTGEIEKDMASTLEKIKELEPDSITVHTLAIKRAARLNTNKDLYKGMESREASAMLARCEKFMEENGYEPYYLYRQKNMSDNLENVGYAKKGKEGLYNVLIMEEIHTILALGAGGSSKFCFRENGRIERVESVKSVKDYIERIDEMIERKRMFLESYYDSLM